MSDRPDLARFPGSIPGGLLRRMTHRQRSQAWWRPNWRSTDRWIARPSSLRV